MLSVAQAENNKTMKKIATTCLFRCVFVAFISPILLKNGRTTFNIVKTYNAAKHIVYKALTNVPALTIAITAAKIHHAVMSSAAAHVIITVPSFVLCMPRSCTILASTGKAVILIAIPMNRAKDKNCVPSAANESYTKYANPIPKAKGIIILA